jgi:hypothetical protein
LHQPSIQPNPRQRFCYPNSGKKPGRQFPINTTVLGIIGQTILLTSGIATPNLTTQPPPSPVSYSSHVAPLSQSISNIHQRKWPLDASSVTPTLSQPRRQLPRRTQLWPAPRLYTSIPLSLIRHAFLLEGAESVLRLPQQESRAIAAPHRGRQQRPITRSITHAPDQTHTRSQLFHCSKRSRRPRAVATLPLRHFH